MIWEALEDAYKKAWEGTAQCNFAILHIPGFGTVTLRRGQPILVNGREGTWVEWHMIKGWMAQKNSEKALKEKYQAPGAAAGECLHPDHTT